MKLSVREWEVVQYELPKENTDELWERIERRTFGKLRTQPCAIALSKPEQRLVEAALKAAFSRHEFVPSRLWSRDHSQVFAYIAHCMLNRKGKLELRRMRAHVKRHPWAVYTGPFHTIPPTTSPTRLVGGILADHDDWDCLDDFVSAGLLNRTGPENDSTFLFTNAGWSAWSKFERHIAENPTRWSLTFDWSTLEKRA